jgi:hypothetical protein
MRLSTATATILPLFLFVWAIIYRSANLVMWDWVGFDRESVIILFGFA